MLGEALAPSTPLWVCLITGSYDNIGRVKNSRKRRERGGKCVEFCSLNQKRFDKIQILCFEKEQMDFVGKKEVVSKNNYPICQYTFTYP